MTEVHEDPVDGPAAAAAPAPEDGTRSPANDNRRRRRGAAVDDWENEGGHFPQMPPAGIDPTDVSPGVSAKSQSAGLAAMRALFESDFASGLMGQRHNTFAHRSRVLRAIAATEHEEDGAPPV